MHQDRQHLAVGGPQFLLEKRLLYLSSVRAQQSDAGKQRTFNLSREPDGDAKQIGRDSRPRGLNEDDLRRGRLSVRTTQRDRKSGRAGPWTQMHGLTPKV